MRPYDVTSYGAASSTAVGERNRVLRNTYWLLGLSMVPTVIGAFLGIQMRFNLSPFAGILLFIGISFGALYAIEKTKQSATGVVVLLGFTFFMGLWLSQLLQVALRFPNGANSIVLAAGGTGVVFVGLATLATVTKKDFSFLGKFLFIGLVIGLLASVANLFLAMPALTLTVSAAFVFIFSLYILYDVSRVVNGGETNYISAALAIYLDIYNLFQNLLVLILSLTGNSRD